MTENFTVAITGGAGFLGATLARRILAAGKLRVNGRDERVDTLLLLDLVEPPADLLADARVRPLTGDLAEQTGARGAGARGEGARGEGALGEPDVIFHLAAAVSAEAEANFDLGMHANLEVLRSLLDRCREFTRPPLFVFTSSLAVYGSETGATPDEIDDDTMPRPQASYGAQKLIGEVLVADYARKGYVIGRTVRLMTVSVRPGRPNGAASSFISGIIREPLDGRRSVCPVPADTPIALSSPRLTVDGILAASAATDRAWGSRTAMNLPSLSTTPAEMLAALDRATGEKTSDLVDWGTDPAVRDIVTRWPARFRTERAAALGLAAPASFDEVVAEYLQGRPRAGAPADQP